MHLTRQATGLCVRSIGLHKVPSYTACMWMFSSVSDTALYRKAVDETTFLRKLYRYCGLVRDLDQILNSGVRQN